MHLTSLLLLASLAPPGPPAVVSPAGAVRAAYADARTLTTHDLPFVRYLWLPQVDRESALRVLRFHLNLLSSKGSAGTVTLVATDLVRIDLRDFGLQRRLETWEKLGQVDVFFHQPVKFLAPSTLTVAWPGGVEKDGKRYPRKMYAVEFQRGHKTAIPAVWLPAKEITWLRANLYTESPVLNGEWFVIQSARDISIRNVDEGVGYSNFLGVSDRKSFFKLIGLDEKEAIRLYKQWREVIASSGVSQQNRIVDAKNAITGRAWVTLDTFTQQGRGNAKRNLRDGEFLHDAEEWFGFNPQGLPIVALFNAAGVRQDSAPDKIGGDTSSLNISRDTRIHNGLSCWRCHGTGGDFLMPLDGWARKTFRQGGRLRLADPDREVTLELQRQYLSDIGRLLRRDRQDYAHAVRLATALKADGSDGLTSAAITKLYGGAWNRYVESPVTIDVAAREVGVPPKVLLEGIRRNTLQRKPGAVGRGGGDLILAAFADDPPQTITRLEWEDSYPLAVAWALGIDLPETVERVKANP